MTIRCQVGERAEKALDITNIRKISQVSPLEVSEEMNGGSKE